MHRRSVWGNERVTVSDNESFCNSIRQRFWSKRKSTSDEEAHVPDSDIWVAHSSDEWERLGAGVETQKNVLRVFGGWGRVPFNEPYAPSLSTIYDGA